MTNIKSIIDEVSTLKKEYQDKSKEAFKKVLKEYFADSETQAIVWGQYVPGFNDGDPCEFSLTDVYFVVKNFDPEDLQDPYDYDESSIEDIHKDDNANSIYDFLNANEDMLEEMFGVNVAVYVTPEAIIVNEYCCGY